MRPWPRVAGGFVASRLKSNIELSIPSYTELLARYNQETQINRSGFFMDFVIHVVAKIVVPLFFIGMAGSAVVIVVSFAEDLKELLGDED